VVHRAGECAECATDEQLLTFESADEVGAAMEHLRLTRCAECTTPDELVELLSDD
jgi:hypothetical protein